jgi:peptidoglycan/xylan/chitin deacetylase (PgdA/CDA1 family)
MEANKGAATSLTQLRTIVGKVVKDVAGRVLVTCGIHKRLLRGKAIVVAFHSITVEKSHGALRCSVEDFERYCRFFAQHLQTERLTQTVGRLEERGALCGQLAITFDDGYLDNAELALPVLHRWSLPATFYVTTGFIETQTQTDWDQKANLRSRWMTWDHVKQLIAAGHDVGAHTVTHINLAAADAQQAEAELRQSRDDIAARAGVAPTHFAVPFGRAFPSLDQTVAIARNLGFRSVSLCRGGIVPRGADAMHIERWPINPLEHLSPYGWLMDVLRDPGLRRPSAS